MRANNSVPRSASTPLGTNHNQSYKEIDMATQSVNQPKQVINLNSAELIVFRIDSMLQLGRSTDFHNLETYVLRDYLWMLSDLVSKLKEYADS